ncbi:MAG: putative membrane protein [Pseudomonas sp.]
MAKTPKILPELSWLQPRLRISRAISLFSFFALAALLVVWNLAYADLHGARTGVILAIELLPLALLAPGLLIGGARAYAWTCFVMNLYFIKGVLAAFDPARYWLGWLELLFSFSLFCAALMYTRWRFQHDRKLAGEV